jgi:TIR domain
MSGIFISYRRDDTAYIAGRLHDRLAAEFGPDRIFRDVDTMRPGADFVQKIDDAVSSCDALVAIIGDQWLSTVDKNGKRRLSNPKDWVRLEIAAALKRGILVVPVLVEDARMPSEAELPAPLRRLARHHAMDLSDQRWDYEVGQLTAVLRDAVAPEPPEPPPRPSPPPPPARPISTDPPAVRMGIAGPGVGTFGAATVLDAPVAGRAGDAVALRAAVTRRRVRGPDVAEGRRPRRVGAPRHRGADPRLAARR